MQTDVIDHGGHTGGLRFTQKCIGLILIEVEVVRNFGTFGVPETRPGRLPTWSMVLPVCSAYARTYVWKCQREISSLHTRAVAVPKNASFAQNANISKNTCLILKIISYMESACFNVHCIRSSVSSDRKSWSPPGCRTSPAPHRLQCIWDPPCLTMKEMSDGADLSVVYYINVAEYSGAISFLSSSMVSWENMSSGN
jgi:hypothetical protein